MPVPAPRSPLPAEIAVAVRGERVVVSNRDGCHYGYRGWTDLYHRDGYEWVDVVLEEDWWAARLLGTAPGRVFQWPAGAVWVE